VGILYMCYNKSI